MAPLKNSEDSQVEDSHVESPVSEVLRCNFVGMRIHGLNFFRQAVAQNTSEQPFRKYLYLSSKPNNY